MKSFSLENRLFSPSFLLLSSSLFVVPFLLISLHFLFNYEKLEDLQERVTSLQERSQRKNSHMRKEKKVLQQINQSQPNYLKQTLESMSFLCKERQKWELFSKQIESPTPSMKERSAFLKSDKNRLQFIQVSTHSNSLFQESEEKQKQAIEVSEEDLKTLLCSIENTPIHPYTPPKNAPQILIKSFELEKKSIPGIAEKTYLVQMNLIKREKAVKP